MFMVKETKDVFQQGNNTNSVEGENDIPTNGLKLAEQEGEYVDDDIIDPVDLESQKVLIKDQEDIQIEKIKPKLTLEEIRERLNTKLNIIVMYQEAVLRLCNTYNCWINSGGRFKLTGEGIIRLMAPLGILYEEIESDIQTNDDGSLIAHCKVKIWVDGNEDILGYGKGIVSTKEPFYAKSGQTQRNQEVVGGQKLQHVSKHALTRALKDAVTRFLGIAPTQEQLESVNVDMDKIIKITFGG
jgi:hypothetical protein